MTFQANAFQSNAFQICASTKPDIALQRRRKKRYEEEIKRRYELTIILVNHHNKGTYKEKMLSKDMIRGGKVMTDFATNVFQMAESTLNTDLRIYIFHLINVFIRAPLTQREIDNFNKKIRGDLNE